MMNKEANNITIAAKKGVLTITVDLTKKGVPSKSGKSEVIASTYGNAFLPELGVTMGLNIYKKAQA